MENLYWSGGQREIFFTDPKDPHYLLDSIFVWRYGNATYYATVALLLFVALSGLLIKNDLFRARWGFIAVALAILPAICEWIVGIRFPWPMKFLIALALVMHMSGGIFEFYFTYYPVYDKLCHLVSAMAITLLVFVTILVLAGETGRNFRRMTVVAGVFTTVIALGLAWEFVELHVDFLSGTSYFVDPTDSFFDTIFNIIGTTFVVVTINKYLKRESLLSLYRRWVPWKRYGQGSAEKGL
ncbi:MAG: hypothetical protein Q7J03_04410 [Methanoregula sp.]|nr:hypothetical protein [Methanoregula sp.]